MMNRERIAVWVVAGLLIGASLSIGYFGTPYTAPLAELDDARSIPGVTITDHGRSGGYELAPTGADSTTAIVFYPGARVHPSAYVPVLAPVVERTNTTIFVPRPPLHLAVLDPAMADAIIRSTPEIDRWYVGGHSLGGAMACRFARRSANRLTGLVLVGSYCDREIRDTGLAVLTIRGSGDTVLNQQAYRRNLGNLPEDTTTTVVISGMNHTQAGAYHGQPGDRPATISYEQAHEELRTALTAFLTGNTSQRARFGPPPARRSGGR